MMQPTCQHFIACLPSIFSNNWRDLHSDVYLAIASLGRRELTKMEIEVPKQTSLILVRAARHRRGTWQTSSSIYLTSCAFSCSLLRSYQEKSHSRQTSGIVSLMLISCTYNCSLWLRKGSCSWKAKKCEKIVCNCA